MNLVGIILAAVSSMVWGFVWYGPLFGNLWMKAAGMNKSDIDKNKDKMPMTYGLALLSSFVMAWVLSQLLSLTGTTTVEGGLMLAFWAWIGFSAPTLLVHSLFENRPWNLFLVNAGYHLAVMLTMGVLVTLI